MSTKPNILLVDDTPANLHSLKKILERLEVNIITADSGNEALTLLLQHDFMLILLDVHMPIMDGYETAELILQMKEYQHVPIIFVTAVNKEETQTFKGYEAGAVDFLYKPVNAEILLSKVKVFLKIWQQRIQLFDQKKALDVLVQHKDALLLEVEQQNQNKDRLLTQIKKQSKKLKNTFVGCSFTFVVILGCISWMYNLISIKNTQLVNYTELLNEKNILFSDLKKALNESNDPKIQDLLKNLQVASVQSLIKRWENNPVAWEWKKQENLSAADDEARYRIVATIAQIANIIAARDKFFIPTAMAEKSHHSCGWVAFGNKDIKSDVDYGIVTIQDPQHLFSYNAIQGRKAVIASIIFRALFGSPSLQLLDTEFYPPSLATFVNEPISSRASFSAIFAQMVNFFQPDELQSFITQLRYHCRHLDSDTADVVIEMLKDAAHLHKDVEVVKTIVPNPELANNILSNKISLSMAQCGEDIDKLNFADCDRKVYLDTFAFLDVLRQHFLPEGFFSRGAYRVICENITGQKHQLAHRKIEEAAMLSGNFAKATIEACAETAARQQSSAEEYLESVGENSAFFHHRSDLIDASKYGTRVYNGALELIHILKAHALSAEVQRELAAFQSEVEQRATEMAMLESAKRGKFFERAFLQIVAKLTQEEMAAHGYTVERRLKAVEQAGRVAQAFFQQACYGSPQFTVRAPQERLAQFFQALPEKAFSTALLAMAESVARVERPLHRELAGQIIRAEAQEELKKMKQRRALGGKGEAELFAITKLEIRQTMARLLAYALKLGVIEKPQSKDTEQFMTVKAEVQQTLSKLLSDTRNIGISYAPHLLAKSMYNNSFSLLWDCGL